MYKRSGIICISWKCFKTVFMIMTKKIAVEVVMCEGAHGDV